MAVADFARRYGPWAIVTGASSGIGAEFARQLVQAGLDVVVVARRRERLVELADSLRATGREVRVAVHDLAQPADIEALIASVADLDVGLLVNNAGLGWKGSFLEQSPQQQHTMLAVNCIAPVVLTRALGPRIAARGRGGIVIVSSTAGMQATPWSALYGATKVFDLWLGEALAVELRAHGVDVLTLCPGGTDTEGPVLSGSDMTQLEGKLMPTDAVVATAIAGLGREDVVVPGFANRAAALLTRFVPRKLAVALAGRVMKRVTKQP